MKLLRSFLIILLLCSNSCQLFYNPTSIKGRKFYKPQVPYKSLKFTFDTSDLHSKDLKIFNSKFMGIDTVSIPDYFIKSFSKVKIQIKNDAESELKVIPQQIRVNFGKKHSPYSIFIFELYAGEKLIWKAKAIKSIGLSSSIYEKERISDNLIALIDDVRDYLCENGLIECSE